MHDVYQAPSQWSMIRNYVVEFNQFNRFWKLVYFPSKIQFSFSRLLTNFLKIFGVNLCVISLRKLFFPIHFMTRFSSFQIFSNSHSWQMHSLWTLDPYMELILEFEWMEWIYSYFRVIDHCDYYRNSRNSQNASFVYLWNRKISLSM